MAGSTITSFVNHGIILGTVTSGGIYSSPLTITSSGGITVSSGYAIYGPNTQAWAVLNNGTILDAPGYDIDLALGGSVGNTGLIQGFGGVVINGAAGTATNSGTIDAKGSSDGVNFRNGGSVTNSAGGLIQGHDGVVISGAAGTVANSGTIMQHVGAGRTGVDLGAGGSVANTGTGLIRGNVGVAIGGGAGTVTNSATIMASAGLGGSDGVAFGAGGSVANVGTGLIQGIRDGVYITGAAGTVTNSATIVGTEFGFGVNLAAGGTVVDSGSISGGSAGAIKFSGGSSSLLVLEAGYHVSGVIQGSPTIGATNTLELSGYLGAVTATYSTLGLVNFQDVLFGAAGNEILKASNTTGTLGTVTISGLTLTSEIIDLTQIGTNATLANGGTASGTHQLMVSGSGGTVILQLDATDGTVFTATSDLGTGSDITVACFCRGTLILSEKGEVGVEDLAIGDRLVTLSGAARAIKWIGRRAYDGRFAAQNRRVLPIRVVAGALAPGVPARDLWVSPEHALYLDGALVPVGLVVNGATITRVESVDRVEYFHIELEGHDVILAERAPAETYVECDNRFMFQNGAEFAELYPDDLPAPWAFCAPRAEEGSAELAAIRAALSKRTAVLGYAPSEPCDPHRIADGKIQLLQSVV